MDDKQVTATLATKDQVSGISLGASHVAFINGKDVQYLEILPPSLPKLDRFAYTFKKPMSSPQLAFSSKVDKTVFPEMVEKIVTNFQYSMALLKNGVVHIHPLTADFFEDRCQAITFPEPTADGTSDFITCAALTQFFFVYGTASGKIVYYDLADLTLVKTTKHRTAIKKIFHQPLNGVLCLFVDDDDQAYVLSHIVETVLKVEQWNTNTTRVIWDMEQKGPAVLFLTYSDSTLTPYVYHRKSLKGAHCSQLSQTTSLPYGYKPFSLINGSSVVCQVIWSYLECWRESRLG